MNKLITTVVVVFVISGLLRYANENYDSISAGIGHAVRAEREARVAERERETAASLEAMTANLAMMSRTEFILIDPPIASPGNTSLMRVEAQRSVDAFMRRAFADDDKWTGALVRLDGARGFDMWLTDLRFEEDGVIAGVNDDKISGLITHAVPDTSTAQPPIGQRYTFTQSAIWDWAITHEGKVYGLYSIRNNLDALPPEIAELAAQNMSEEAVPADW